MSTKMLKMGKHHLFSLSYICMLNGNMENSCQNAWLNVFVGI